METSDWRAVCGRTACTVRREGRLTPSLPLSWPFTHRPSSLTCIAFARELTDSERADRAEDFLRIRRETGLQRRWEEGRILGVPMDRYDPLLLEGCTTRWTPAARVVGTAMGQCDGHNLMSDLFFSSRLRLLIDAGRIEADGSRARLPEYAVRLAAP